MERAGLGALNALPFDEAKRELQRLCHSERWADAVARAMPFRSATHALEVMDTTWASMGPADYLEAFSAHPRIGDRSAMAKSPSPTTPRVSNPSVATTAPTVPPNSGAGAAAAVATSRNPGGAPITPEAAPKRSGWEAEEQAGASAAGAEVLAELAAWNDRYYERFGFVFLVCATGKTADEMLRLLRSRYPHERSTEIFVAAEEQRKITHLRFDRLLRALVAKDAGHGTGAKL